MKNGEEYFLIVLQLYMPWRNDSELKSETGFDLRFRMVKNIITFNIEKPTIFALPK